MHAYVRRHTLIAKFKFSTLAISMHEQCYTYAQLQGLRIKFQELAYACSSFGPVWSGVLNLIESTWMTIGFPGHAPGHAVALTFPFLSFQ